jgi:DNA-binding transcriptional regulator YiaG
MEDRERSLNLAKALRNIKIDFSGVKDEHLNREHEKLLIAGKIKAYRVIYKLTQEELAKKLDIPKLQIIRWESGKNMPNRWALKKLKEERII